MLIILVVAALAGASAVAVGYIMWWASQRSTLVNICIGMVLAVLAFATAILIGYLLMRSWGAPLDPL